MSPRHVSLVLLTLLTACGPGPDGTSPPDGSNPEPTVTDPTTPGGPPETPALSTVEERLTYVGAALPELDSADLQGTGLRDFTGDALPDAAHPLRDGLAELAGRSELYVLGTGPGGGQVLDLERTGLPGVDDFVIDQPGGGHEVMAQPVAVAAHLDDDGRTELVVVDVRANQVFVQVIEDEQEGFDSDSLEGRAVGEWAGGITGLVATARDVDGDDLDEIFLAGVIGFDIQVRVYDPATETLSPFQILSPLPTVFAPLYAIDIAAGDTDGDPAEEAVLVANHRESDGITGTTRAISFDWDPTQGLDRVGDFDRTIQLDDGSPVVAGGVALADIDADHIDEVVIGGTSDRQQPAAYDVHLVVWDLENGAIKVWEDAETFTTERSDSIVRIRQSQLAVGRTSISGDTPEIDNPEAFQPFDTAEDVLVNNVLFEFSPAREEVGDNRIWPTGLRDDARIAAMARPPRKALRYGSDTELIVDRDTAQFALAAVDGTFVPHAVALAASAGLFAEGESLGDHALIAQPTSGVGSGYASTVTPDGPHPLQLVPANVDNDSIVVRYLPDGHRMTYSEPLLMAAVAAPPCYEGPVGQFLANCGMYYGTTVGGFGASSGSLGHSISVMAGFGFEDRTFTQSEAKATVEVELSTSFTTTQLEEVTISQAYENGTSDDYVLASVLALEQFTYEIVDAPPAEDGSSRIGEPLTIYVPRTAAHQMLFLTADRIRPALRPSQVAALDAVFVHTPTDPSTYLRRDEVGPHLSALGVDGPGCTGLPAGQSVEDCGYFTVPQPTRVPLANPPVEGAGSGLPSDISISLQNSTTQSLSLESTLDVELSAGGAIFGLSIGQSQQSDVTFGQSSTVSYGMSLGGIDDAIYAPYGGGVLGFTHAFDCVDAEGEPRCQTFEVVTAWVTDDG
ncbi:MAG: hypothetical protein AAF211_00070 [Myxococcota bacterium]